jgi:hypothetical protein
MCWGIMGFILYMNCYVLGNHGIHSVYELLCVGKSWDSFCIIFDIWEIMGFILYYFYQLGNHGIHSVLFLPVGKSWDSFCYYSVGNPTPFNIYQCFAFIHIYYVDSQPPPYHDIHYCYPWKSTYITICFYIIFYRIHYIGIVMCWGIMGFILYNI